MHQMKPGETHEEYRDRMELYALLKEGKESGNGMAADEFFAAFWKERENELSHRNIGSRTG